MATPLPIPTPTGSPTPPPPQLSMGMLTRSGRSDTGSSMASERLATPDTPNMTGFMPSASKGKRRAVAPPSAYGLGPVFSTSPDEMMPSLSLSGSSSGSFGNSPIAHRHRHRRTSSAPFMFDFGDPLEFGEAEAEAEAEAEVEAMIEEEEDSGPPRNANDVMPESTNPIPSRNAEGGDHSSSSSPDDPLPLTPPPALAREASSTSRASDVSGPSSRLSGASTPSSASRTLGLAVRRGIVKSKASLRRLRSDGDNLGGAHAPTPPPSGATSAIAGAGAGPTSIGGAASSNLPDDQSAPSPSPSPSTPRARLKFFLNQTRRQRAQSLSSSASSSNAPSAGPSSAQLNALAAAYDDFSATHHPHPSYRTGIMPGDRSDGRGTLFVRSARVRLGSRRHSSLAMTPSQSHPPLNVMLTSAGLHGPTAPLSTDELVWGTLSYRAPISSVECYKVDHFTTRLPRELKLGVLKALVDSYEADGRTGRWDGINGARRELIRLSRVSKEWRSLCFDGSFWTHADFTPFAAVLHSETMRAIVAQARPCVKDLKLQGLECIPGETVTNAPDLDCLYNRDDIYPEPPLKCFTSLVSLDLRGCHSLTESDVIGILSMSPGLKKLNLKGSRLRLTYILLAVREKIDALEELDLSRCLLIEFSNVETFVCTLNPRQRAALHTLRIAGLNNPTGVHLLKWIGLLLPNLKVLDMMGCRWLGYGDIEDYVTALGDAMSPLEHLILSSCTNLTAEAFELLVSRLPEMRLFEAAGLEAVFYLDPPPTLAALVGSMPKLERLDLDSTGRYGGVCDRLIHELIPGACTGSPLAESQLVELRIGLAKNVSAAALLRLVQALPNLRILEADATEADDSVMREFISRRRMEDASLSLVDCHSLTPASYTEVAGKTRARAGWDDYTAGPFTYSDIDMEPRPVVKTFWAWRRVGVPRHWREAREQAERDLGERSTYSPPRTPGISRSGWWRTDDPDDLERGACSIM